MYSRAHLLIERELDKFNKDPPSGIEAWPMFEDTIFEWMAKIKGPKNTPWEGGIFKVYIRFDEHFNVRPPQMFFQTIPFHPNVEVSTGRPCVDFLDDYEQWDENCSLSMLLVSLQTLLAKPSLKNAVNLDAADMLRSAPQSYLQMVQECVAASQRVEAGGSPQVMVPDTKVRFDQFATSGPRTAPTRSSNINVSKLSFDDYHRTWCGIATSKTKPESVNPLLESIKDKQGLQEIHLGLPREEIEEQMRKQMEDHNTLMYGRFKTKPSLETVREARLAQLDRMKRIYLPPRQSPLPVTGEINIERTLPAFQGKEDTHDGWEKEVDDLVDWTNNLDSNAIDAT